MTNKLKTIAITAHEDIIDAITFMPDDSLFVDILSDSYNHEREAAQELVNNIAIVPMPMPSKSRTLAKILRLIKAEQAEVDAMDMDNLEDESHQEGWNDCLSHLTDKINAILAGK